MATIITVIAPHPSVCGQKVKLGVIDQIAPRDYAAALLFFHLPRRFDKRHVYQNIRTGVQNAAKANPQLLCCVSHSNNDREEMELQWDASSGATVTFRDYMDPSLRDEWTSGSFDDLAREHFPLGKLPRRLVHGLVQQERPALLPCLAVQTSFIDGGLILSFCVHHTLCDGPSTYSFAKSLAEHTKAASLGEEVIFRHEINYADRVAAVMPETDVMLSDLPDWRMVASNDGFSDGTSYTLEELPEVMYSTYFISESNLCRLGQTLETASGRRFTQLETVGAFIWKSVLQARQIDVETYPEAKLSITVDARGRMLDPEVSSSYWGNFCEPNAVARMRTADLCDSPHATPEGCHKVWQQTLPEAARRIGAAIGAVDNKAVRRLVGLLNQMSQSTSLTWNVNRWPGPDMLIVCLHRHFYNSLDFGPDLGMSEAMRFTVGNTEDKPDGRCLLMPPSARDGKGLEIMLQYDRATMERLKHDRSFREFFEWRN